MTTSTSDSLPTDRIIFLDKIRYSLVIGVVVLHAACSYARIIPWWSVQDPIQSPAFDLLIILLDIFLMPVLFFIAGFFAVPSLTARGSVRFVKAKLKRLGIPLLLIGFFFVPIISFIGYRNRTPDAVNFFRFWWMQMETVIDWHWVNYASEQTALLHANDFTLWHLWFISLLLIFFIVTALVHWLSPRWFQTGVPSTPHDSRFVRRGFAVVALASALGFTLINRIIPDWGWCKFSGLILIQPTRAPLYVALFVLGIQANIRGWFTARTFPGRPWLWFAGCVVGCMALLTALGHMDITLVPTPWLHAMVHGVLRSVACLAFLGFFLSATQHRGNHPSRIWHNLHTTSYGIYLIHLPLVVVLQLVLLPVSISIYAKFIIIGLAALTISWVLERYLIEAYPVPAGGLLVAGFFLGCLFTAG